MQLLEPNKFQNSSLWMLSLFDELSLYSSCSFSLFSLRPYNARLTLSDLVRQLSPDLLPLGLRPISTLVFAWSRHWPLPRSLSCDKKPMR